jgi:hypothetical protein
MLARAKIEHMFYDRGLRLEEEMINSLIRFGAMFDWITPLWTFILDFINRPSVGYNIDVNSGWSAYAIRDLLKGSGIKIWGLTIFGSTITFRTRKAQAAYAQYLMDRVGIPYRGGISTQGYGGYGGYGSYGRGFGGGHSAGPQRGSSAPAPSWGSQVSGWLDEFGRRIDRL